jgi:hydroxymethylpyrimidine/phosphomethylpyrimidine kinase
MAQKAAKRAPREENRPRTLPCALAIGGLDPGGGAGVLADVRAFAAAGVFGCAAAACVTVQSTAGLRRVRALPRRELTEQVLEVIAHQRVRAIKVGALGSVENVRAVGRILARFDAIPSVVDTPMRPTRSARGTARLLAHKAVEALREELLPRATLVTVNAEEAEVLLGKRVASVADAREAAEALFRGGAKAVLVKGGHLLGASATDVLAVGREVVELRARRVAGGPVHGTGCTFASLVAGWMAAREASSPGREELLRAVRWAKRVHHAALVRTATVGEGSGVLVFHM